MVPENVLSDIKNDHKTNEELENTTVLIAELVGF